jgi:acetoacetyl-CoA synthetase
MSQPLWTPSPEGIRDSNFTHYRSWLECEAGLRFADYHEVRDWSVRDVESFWDSIREYFDVQLSAQPTAVLTARSMPGAHWFPGAELNYAQHAFRHARSDHAAILYQSELRPLASLSWRDLDRQVASAAESLRRMGVRRGDRVAALLPNIPEAVIAFLASASIGAVWSGCSPDFGATGVLERFRQIGPKVLIAADGYSYAGRRIDRLPILREIRADLPSVEHFVLVPYLDAGARMEHAHTWAQLLEHDAGLCFEPVPFEHPLWILYSSGTSGAPKAIVHGHGGILLEHLKTLVLQNDMRAGDRFFWNTTTGWMMWNVLVGGLLAGCSIVLYDGSPAYPGGDVLWKLVADARVTRFGAGAAWFMANVRSRTGPGKRFDFRQLRAIGSTGSPLPPEGFRWIYDEVKRDVWLASSSGGTDVATAFFGGCATLPVHAGELQGAALGVAAAAFDDSGSPVIDEPGELVIREPMPSMPLFLWNDPGGRRYRDSYFARYSGVWWHGDRIRITDRGSAVILGRSDATLNRRGVRMGTTEMYQAVESVPAVVDSLCVGIEEPSGGYWMPLFVALGQGVELDDRLREEIRAAIRVRLTSQHVPDEIVRVDAVPRTLNGKKPEIPIRRILQGEPPAQVLAASALANPESLTYFIQLAAARRTKEESAND